MPALIAVAWIGPPVVLALTLTLVLKRPRIAAPTANAVATGVATAAMAIVFFDLAGLYYHGPWADRTKPGWAWKVPAFAAYVALFAWCSGWCCATLYLAGREALRGRWGGARCPSAITTSLAFVLLLALTAFYVDHARQVTSTITQSRDRAARQP